VVDRTPDAADGVVVEMADRMHDRHLGDVGKSRGFWSWKSFWWMKGETEVNA